MCLCVPCIFQIQPMQSNQPQQFQGQVNMQPQQIQTQQMPSAQQMQISSQQQQPQVSYPHGQTLPANLQGIVTTGQQQVVGLPITSQQQQQMPPTTMVNVTHHQQAMSMGHLPNNVELNMNIPAGMSQQQMVVNRQNFIPQQVIILYKLFVRNFPA